MLVRMPVPPPTPDQPAPTATTAAPAPSRLRADLLRVLGIVLLVALAVIAGHLLTSTGALDGVDHRVQQALAVSAGSAGAWLALLVDLVLGPRTAPLLVVVLGVAVGMARRSGQEGLRTALVAAVPWVLAKLVKLLVVRPRPGITGPTDLVDPSTVHQLLVPMPTSSSFPSGHTAIAAALGCALVLSLRPGRGRGGAIVGAVLLALVTAWSRVALGVHHGTDVLASLVLVPPLAVLLAGLLAGRLPRPRHQIDPAAGLAIGPAGGPQGTDGGADRS